MNERFGGPSFRTRALHELSIHLPRLRPSPFTVGIILAVAIGVVAGLGAVGFRALIDLFHSAFFDHTNGAFSSFGRYSVVLLPALGGIIVGLLVYFFAREAKGHGVPEVMLAVAKSGGRIRGRVAIVKTLASSVCIGSGGSVGREGPIVQIGSAAASFVGQRLGVSANSLRVFVACGAAGGISATFNAPIAGVFFALEVILRTFSIQYFGVVVLSAVTADIISRAFFGNVPIFEVPAFALNSTWELGLYVLLGVIAALLALGFTRLLYLMEDLFDRIRHLPEYGKPFIGGLAVGAIGLFYPQVFGVGYDSISDALTGGFSLSLLVLLVFLKPLATTFTLGSGGSGGVFAPALFIGAMAGIAFGHVMGNAFPGIVGPAGGYGLAGMAAVFAGAAWAPITAILIVFEMTRDYAIILPLMLTVVVSALLTRSLSHDSIYTLKLTRRGVDMALSGRSDSASNTPVGAIMEVDYPRINGNVLVRDLPPEFERTGVHGLPVLNGQRELVGIVTASDVEQAIIDGFESHTAYDIATHSLVTAYPDESIATVLRKRGAQEVGYIPVVARNDPTHLLGVLRRQDIIRAYAQSPRQGHAEDEEGLGHAD